MKPSETSDRRRNRRVMFDAPVSLQAANGDNYDTILIDISLKGALTRIPDNWQSPPAQPITLRIHLDQADTMICMQSHIAHTEDAAIGFHCESMDMDSITHLRRLVELNLGDEKLLERELAALG